MELRTVVCPLLFPILAICNLRLLAAVQPFEGGLVDFAHGGELLRELQTFSKLPTGQCWLGALAGLQESCSELTEDRHVTLALRFSTCFLEMSGRSHSICPDNTSPKDCLKKMDSEEMATFRLYFLHTSTLCAYLRQDLWQLETRRSVNLLTKTTEDVTHTLKQNEETQKTILEGQQQSLKLTSNLQSKNIQLIHEVEKVKTVFNSFEEAAKESRTTINEMLEIINKIHSGLSWIVGESTLYERIAVYALAGMFSLFVTNFKRVRGVRVYVILFYVLSFIVEQTYFNHLVATGYPYAAEELKSIIWTIRKIFFLISYVIVLICMIMYEDIEKKNQKALNDMMKQMATLVKNAEEARAYTWAVCNEALRITLGHRHTVTFTRTADDSFSITRRSVTPLREGEDEVRNRIQKSAPTLPNPVQAHTGVNANENISTTDVTPTTRYSNNEEHELRNTRESSERRNIRVIDISDDSFSNYSGSDDDDEFVAQAGGNEPEDTDEESEAEDADVEELLYDQERNDIVAMAPTTSRGAKAGTPAETARRSRYNLRPRRTPLKSRNYLEESVTQFVRAIKDRPKQSVASVQYFSSDDEN